jgi:uncharacterized membrane protein
MIKDITLYLHLITALPCIPIGAYLLLSKKGDSKHRNLGKLWMVLMFITALSTAFLPSVVGPKLFNRFGLLHLFTLLTLWRAPYIIIYARRGNMTRHKRTVRALYVALIATFLGAFVPGRLLSNLIFSNNWIIELFS